MSDMAKINRLLRDQNVGLDCSPFRLSPAVRKRIYNQHADDLNGWRDIRHCFGFEEWCWIYLIVCLFLSKFQALVTR